MKVNKYTHLDKKQLQTGEFLPTNIVTNAPSELWQAPHFKGEEWRTQHLLN